MDSREFAAFVKEKILEKADSYNEILYSVSYKNMEEGKWIAGCRSALISIADSMPRLLKEFYGEED